MGKWLTNLIVLALLAASGPAAGDAAGVESPWRLGVAFGYGQRSNPLIQSESVPLIVDIDIAWFGKKVFFDNGDAGYTLHQGKQSTLSVVGRINSDRLFFSRTNTRFVSVVAPGGPPDPTLPPVVEQVSVPDRNFAVEAGLELLSDGAWGRLQLTAFHDISGTHDGYEVGANYARGFRSNRWFFEPSFELSYKSAKQNDYFWGVNADESTVFLPAYKAGSGVNFSTRMLLNYQIGRHWAAVAVVYYETLAPTISDSPLVKDDFAVGNFLGFQYRF